MNPIGSIQLRVIPVLLTLICVIRMVALVQAQSVKKPVVIVYASQTGQSKVIAEQINDMLFAEQEYDPQLYCISQNGKEFSLNEVKSPVVFVCSTTGDGEVPETARKVYSTLKRLDTESNRAYLANLNYALLGLGDSNYAQFCNGPKLFHKRFEDLGAKCFYGPFWADDGTGLDEQVEPFKDGLFDALAKYFSSLKEIIDDIQELNNKVNTLSMDDPALRLVLELSVPDKIESHLQVSFSDTATLDKRLDESSLTKVCNLLYPQSASGVFKATVLSNTLLTPTDWVKSCYDLKFKIESKEFTYEPGHAIDILCSNDPNEVDNLLKRLNLGENADKQIDIKSLDESKKVGQVYPKLSSALALSMRTLFLYCVDIRNTGLKKNFLRTLAAYCSDKSEQDRLLQLASKEGNDQYLKLIKESNVSVLDLLNVFKSCEPPIDLLIQMLPQLNPRPYSLCTSMNSSSDLDSEIVFNLVKFQQELNRTYDRLGVGTGFLSKLDAGSSFYFMKRKFDTFTFPTDTSPIIMIGPGTGIAPFISYIRQDNIEQKAHLFYGCRDPRNDFLFGEELMTTLRARLARFSLSLSQFSFDDNKNVNQVIKNEPFHQFVLDSHVPKNSRYVQDSLRHHSKDIVSLILDSNAYVYVCGDAKNMAKDVFNCLIECIKLDRGMSEQDATKHLNEMIKAKRYKQDIWA